MSEPIPRHCILIVEPDLVIRHELAEYLRECGYRVFEAVDTDEATKILDNSDIQIDAILCDVDSPGKFDGFELSRWVKQNKPSSNIVLSGSVEHASQKASDLCEEGPVLRKPYDHGMLLDRIKRLIAQRDRNAR